MTTEAYNKNVKHEIDAEFKKYLNLVHHEYVFKLTLTCMWTVDCCCWTRKYMVETEAYNNQIDA